MLKVITWVCACFLLAAVPASAQDTLNDFWGFMSEEAKTLTVAAAAPETVFNSVSNVTVIDRHMIENYNFASVSEALQAVPGVSVIRTYLMHNIPTVRGALQEHYANKVLVMIDNVPMWHAVTGEGDLDRVGIDSVERIEVLRGPASVLYGTNALTGAINIVLRKPAVSGAMGSVSGGMATGAGGYSGASGVSRAGGRYAWKGNRASYVISADAREESQPSVLFTDEARTENLVREYINARSLNFAGSYGATTCLFNASRSDQNFLGNTISLASGELFNEVREAALASCTRAFAPAWGDLKYTLTYDWQRRNIPRDASDNVRSDIVGSRLVNNLGARIPLPQDFYVEAGASQEYRNAQRYLNYYSNTGAEQWDNSLSGRRGRETSAHAQVGYHRAPWNLLAGSRFTSDRQAGDNLSSRVSAIYLFSETSSLKALFSQSFRSPTPFEQYFKSSPVTVLGNPGLKPEKTETFELSYLAARGNFFGHLTTYLSRYKDSIFRDLGSFTRDGVSYPSANHYANAPAYQSSGLELEGRYESRNTHAFLALERINSSRGDEHSIAAPGVFGLPGGSSWNFKHVPEYAVSGGLTRAIGSFFAASNFNGFGPSRTLRGRIGPQYWADFSAGYRKRGVRHTLAVRNVTGGTVDLPEYVRLRVVESLPLYTGRRLEYTFEYRF